MNDGQGNSKTSRNQRNAFWAIAIAVMFCFLFLFYHLHSNDIFPAYMDDIDGDGIPDFKDTLIFYPNQYLKSHNHQELLTLIPKDSIYDNQTINFTDGLYHFFELGLLPRVKVDSLLKVYHSGKSLLDGLRFNNSIDYQNLNYQYEVLELLRKNDVLNPTRLEIIAREIKVNLDFLANQSYTSPDFLSNWSSNRFTEWNGLMYVHYFNMGFKFQPVKTFMEMEGLLLSEDKSDFVKAMNAAADNLIQIDNGNDIFYRWEYYFQWNGHDPPWSSAMANGMGLEMLAYAFSYTNNQTYLGIGEKILRSFSVPWFEGGMLDADEHGYWYLEYTYSNKTRVLNGFLRALTGLYGYYNITGDYRSFELFKNGSDEAIYHLPEYDTGNWSKYSLENPDAPIHYHGFHIRLLTQLYDYTGNLIYKEFSERWQEYLEDFSIYHNP